MLKVVGLEHITGTFEGNPYDNYRFYVVDDEKQNNLVFGYNPKIVKVKASIVHKVISSDSVAKLQNHHVDFLYDSYSNVAQFNIID